MELTVNQINLLDLIANNCLDECIITCTSRIKQAIPEFDDKQLSIRGALIAIMLQRLESEGLNVNEFIDLINKGKVKLSNKMNESDSEEKIDLEINIF